MNESEGPTPSTTVLVRRRPFVLCEMTMQSVAQRAPAIAGFFTGPAAIFRFAYAIAAAEVEGCDFDSSKTASVVCSISSTFLSSWASVYPR